MELCFLLENYGFLEHKIIDHILTLFVVRAQKLSFVLFYFRVDMHEADYNYSV